MTVTYDWGHVLDELEATGYRDLSDAAFELACLLAGTVSFGRCVEVFRTDRPDADLHATLRELHDGGYLQISEVPC